MYFTSSYVDWYLFHENILNCYWDIERTRSMYMYATDGQTSELNLLPWTWEMVDDCCANTLDSGCNSFWPGLSQSCDLDFGSWWLSVVCDTPSGITMWSYNQNIMRLVYPGTKPIVTVLAWLTDFGSKLWLNWYRYICMASQVHINSLNLSLNFKPRFENLKPRFKNFKPRFERKSAH